MPAVSGAFAGEDLNDQIRASASAEKTVGIESTETAFDLSSYIRLKERPLLSLTYYLRKGAPSMSFDRRMWSTVRLGLTHLLIVQAVLTKERAIRCASETDREVLDDLV